MLNIHAPSFAVVNLGCKVNRVESDSIAAHLLAGGGVRAEPASADLIVVNSCTVTGEADKKTRKAIRAALRANPRAQIVVTGCGVAVDAGSLREIDPRVQTIGRVDLFTRLSDCGLAAPRYGEGFRTRVNVKVQDGCDHACTYCIVHVARGPARSAPFHETVEEAAAYFSRGVKELVLTGIDLGSYRFGDYTISDLAAALVEQADKHCPAGEPAARIRISSIEPKSIDERFIDLLAESGGRICRHLHLPLQSGSTRVLRQMARPYTAEFFSGLVEDLYSRIPRLSLTTDVICGFPGESEGDFEATLEACRKSRFSKIHVFPYSMRSGTPAADRADQVPDDVKAGRAVSLRRLSEELRRSDRSRRAGTGELAVVETTCALTESYHELPVPEGSRPGELVRVVFAPDAG